MKKIILIFSILAISIFGFSQKVVNNGSKIVTNGSKVITYTQWSPSDLNLIAWYEFDNLTDGVISTWVGLSGNGNTLIQSTAINQPTKDAIGVNFLGNDFMRCVLDKNYTQPVTFFVVYKSLITTGTTSEIFDGSSTKRLTLATSSGLVSAYSPTPLLSYSKSVPFTEFIITTVKFDGSNTAIYENETLKNTGNTGGSDFDELTVGGYVTGTSPFIGIIKAIIIVDGEATTDNLNNTWTYLNNKYTIY